MASAYRKSGRAPYATERYVGIDERNHACDPGGDDLEEIGRELGLLRPDEVLPI